MDMISNQLKAAWRNYAPGGKRPKLIKIPFMGQMNNRLRAQGTKRIPIVSSKFNRHELSGANFMAPPIPQPYAPAGYPPPYPPQYLPPYQMPPASQGYPPQYGPPPQMPSYRQTVKQSQSSRSPITSANSIYRSGIDTSKELRGWKRELDPVRRGIRRNMFLNMQEN